MDLDILFKQTTSERVKCRVCSNSVKGEEGYIKINLSNMGYYGRWTEKRIVICMDCFKGYLDNITKAKENKSEAYRKRVRMRILKGLK